MDEGPLEAFVFGADARVQDHVWGLHLLSLLRRSLQRPTVRALRAETLPRAAGVSAPSALRLLQTLGTCSQAGAVLGWRRGKGVRHLWYISLKNYCCTQNVLLCLYCFVIRDIILSFYIDFLAAFVNCISFYHSVSPESPWNKQQNANCNKKVQCGFRFYLLGFQPFHRQMQSFLSLEQDIQIKEH